MMPSESIMDPSSDPSGLPSLIFFSNSSFLRWWSSTQDFPRFPNNKGVIAMDKTGLSWTSTSKQWTLKRRFQPSNKLDFFTIKPWDISEFCDLKKQRMGRNLKQMDLTIDLILISIDFIINRGRHEASKLHQFKCFAEPQKRMKQPREV